MRLRSRVGKAPLYTSFLAHLLTSDLPILLYTWRLCSDPQFMRSVWQCYDALATDGDTSSASSACVITLLISVGPQAPTSLPARCLCVDARCGCTCERFPIAPSRPPQLGPCRGDGGDNCQCDEPKVIGMNRMIGTKAGLSVQTEGTMVRLPNQRSADSLPKFFFPFPVLFLSAPIDSTRHRYL